MHWLQSFSVKFDKMQKLSVFVRNRLANIEKFCQVKPVSFCHVAGESNPADCVTRPFSFVTLQNRNFFHGPNFLKSNLNDFCIDSQFFTPNPRLDRCDVVARDQGPSPGDGAVVVVVANAS